MMIFQFQFDRLIPTMTDILESWKTDYLKSDFLNKLPSKRAWSMQLFFSFFLSLIRIVNILISDYNFHLEIFKILFRDDQHLLVNILIF